MGVNWDVGLCPDLSFPCERLLAHEVVWESTNMERLCTLCMHQYSKQCYKQELLHEAVWQTGGVSTDKKGIISALTPLVDMLEGGAAQRRR